MRGGARFYRSAGILLLLVGVVLFGGCDQLLNLANDNPGTIQGVVRNSQTNALLTVPVNVSTDDGTSTVTGSGTYRLDDVSTGSRTVYFTAQGYEPYTRTINVNSGETANLDAYMIPQTGSIYGTIRDFETSQLITQDVSISLDNNTPIITNTGSYNLENVAVGLHTVTFTSDGYQQYSQNINVSVGQNAELSIQMQLSAAGTGSLSGIIYEAGTSNQIYENVYIQTDDGRSTATSSGNYSLSNVQPGTRTITASASGFESFSTQVQVYEGQNVVFDLYLTRSSTSTGEVYGYVYDAANYQPLAGANVYTDVSGSTTTDGSGWYRLVLEPGDYNITASTNGYDLQTQRIHVYAGNSINYNFYLNSTGGNMSFLFGYIRNSNDSSPITDAHITSDDGYSVYSDYQGYYQMSVTPGNRTINVDAANYSSSSVQIYLGDAQQTQYDFWLSPTGGGYATIVGYVTDYQTGAPLIGAYVYTDDGNSAYTDEYGMFNLSVNPGYRVFYSSMERYYEGRAEQFCYEGMTNFVYIQQQPTTTGNGYIAGWITSAVDNTPLSGVYVYSDDGYNGYSDESGYFEFQVPAGQHTFTFTMDGFFDTSQETYVDADNWSYLYVGMSPVLNPGDGVYRFVLNWGEFPQDLDSHLFTPVINDYLYHIWFEDGGFSDQPPYATLDVDETGGYGPETITIYQMVDGAYSYYIYNYSGDAPMAGCGATVSIYNEYGLVQQVTIPGSGEGRWWKVCTVEDTYVTIYNQIQVDDPPELGTITSRSRGPVLNQKPMR